MDLYLFHIHSPVVFHFDNDETLFTNYLLLVDNNLEKTRLLVNLRDEMIFMWSSLI